MEPPNKFTLELIIPIDPIAGAEGGKSCLCIRWIQKKIWLYGIVDFSQNMQIELQEHKTRLARTIPTKLFP